MFLPAERISRSGTYGAPSRRHVYGLAIKSSIEECRAQGRCGSQPVATVEIEATYGEKAEADR
jgi:hypothetical protein